MKDKLLDLLAYGILGSVGLGMLFAIYKASPILLITMVVMLAVLGAIGWAINRLDEDRDLE